MILFTIAALIVISLIIFTVLVVSATGAIGIVMFGDVIVCILLIVWMIGAFRKKKK